MAAYDVFLSYASVDKDAVERLARRLSEDDFKPFFDRWYLVPGNPWQESLEHALDASLTCAVFVGKAFGPWQNEEMRTALDERARNPHFRVIPVLLPGARMPAKKKLPRFLHRLTWVDFQNGLDDDDAYHRLVSGIRGDAPGPGTVPPAPAASYRAKLPPQDLFVHRRELDQVRGLLVGAAGSTVGITTALRGAGGFGKTALARALCDEREVRAAYPDGILWTTIGDGLRDADRVDRVLDLVRWWTEEEPPGFKSARDAGDFLKKVLAGERVLVVVDDAWRSADVEPFRGLGPGTAVLVTTRDGGILPADCRRVKVDAMERSEAVKLLGTDLELDVNRLDALAKRLGEWPLLLKLVNRQLRELVHDGGLSLEEALREIEDEFDEFGVTAFDVDDETARDKTVERTLGVSLRRLADDDRQRFRELAVFPEDVDVPLDVLERFWELPAKGVRQLCKRLHSLSLLLRFERAARTIRLHDVVRQYLIGEIDNLPEHHRRLLERCLPISERWTDLAANEAYLWRHLAGHLAGANERTQLRRLLFDLDYLEGKLRMVDIDGLLADYDVLGAEGEARTIQEALRHSWYVLVRERGELLGQLLAGQLLARLAPVGEEGRRLLREAAERTPLRPRRVRMSRVGGPLVHALGGHTGRVNAVMVRDGDRLVSASFDPTLRVWDIESGETIRTLEGHTKGVSAVVVLGDERLISASFDHTLRMWDVESGEPIRTLNGHTDRVSAVAVLDDTSLVSASRDKTLRIWDTESGKTIRTLEGHTQGVSAIAVLNDTRLVSASWDKTLRLWDVESGETIHTLEGHTTGLSAVAVLDDKRLVSASFDHTLRVWDVDSGDPIRTLEGHTNWIVAVAVLDNNCLVSASWDKTLRVWDVETGETIRTLEGHSDSVNEVVVLDDKRVISVSLDHALRVWDVKSGVTMAVFAFDAPLWVVAVTPDGRRVVAGDERGGVHFLDLDLS